ncbi:MAG: FAD-dependent oxidoreductase [Gammaproteobacteria bacterium]|nr:FAD-dependent oxidoreductase [Gammaproteobacteria bacterium]
MRYSILSLAQQALRNHQHWPQIIAPKNLKSHYSIVIVGAGGHGLATAYYLSQNHGINDVLVIDSGWIGGGNTARNTTMVRSDYLLPASFALKNFALELWGSLSQALNFNLMYSPRGYLDLAHSDGELEHFMLRANAMCLGGASASILTRRQIAEKIPSLNLSKQTRFPISGALFQPEGGVVRHDAVAWGFARQASDQGIHIQQNCAVDSIQVNNGQATAVITGQGKISADRILVAASAGSARLLADAGIPLPLELINVQAFVSEPVKPVLDHVVNYNAGLSYISQSDKGELVMGGATDGYISSARRGSFARIEDTLKRVVQMFPFLSNLRLMRHWSGTADIPMDGNAIVGATEIDNLFVNCGWGYAGFKATPAVGWKLAELLADGQLPEMLKPFALNRFAEGRLIDDSGIGPYPWLH